MISLVLCIRKRFDFNSSRIFEFLTFLSFRSSSNCWWLSVDYRVFVGDVAASAVSDGHREDLVATLRRMTLRPSRVATSRNNFFIDCTVKYFKKYRYSTDIFLTTVY